MCNALDGVSIRRGRRRQKQSRKPQLSVKSCNNKIVATVQWRKSPGDTHDGEGIGPLRAPKIKVRDVTLTEETKVGVRQTTAPKDCSSGLVAHLDAHSHPLHLSVSI